MADSPPPLPHPEGRTLWEMFTGWTKRKMSGDRKDGDDDDAEPPNPLEWTPGLPVTVLNASHGPDFQESLVIVEAVRHCVRRLAGKEHGFVDYVLRITPRQGNVRHAMLRCLPRAETTGTSTSAWDKLLLHRHDEFGWDREFEEVLQDESGIFNVECPSGGEPASFIRLNGLHGPWEVLAKVDRQETIGVDSDSRQRVSQSLENIRYWDYGRQAEGVDEFLFVEINDRTGWTEIWRGSFVVL